MTVQRGSERGRKPRAAGDQRPELAQVIFARVLRLDAEQLLGVPVVDLVEDVAGQADPVDLPGPLDGRGVLELPVPGLEVAVRGVEEELLVVVRMAEFQQA